MWVETNRSAIAKKNILNW